MAEKKFTISILGESREIRGPLGSKEELRELERYLEKTLLKLFDKKPAELVASSILNDRGLVKLVLQIAWDYLTLKREMERVKAELSDRLERALELARFVRERGGS